MLRACKLSEENTRKGVEALCRWWSTIALLPTHFRLDVDYPTIGTNSWFRSGSWCGPVEGTFVQNPFCAELVSRRSQATRSPRKSPLVGLF
jgi:hypothetical protein